MEPFEHQVDHGDLHPSFAGFCSIFIVFAQPATSAQPHERTL